MFKKLLLGVCMLCMCANSGKSLTLHQETKELEHASTEFKIYDKVKSKPNFMFSPFSIKSAFMLAVNGCKGKTQEEMLNTFKIHNLQQYNNKMKNIINSLNDSGIINICNSVWLNKDYVNNDIKFQDDYISNIYNNFNAEVYTVNNNNAVNLINSYVKEKTNEKINEIIDDSNFLCSLINTIYFKADWEKPFLKEMTGEQDFTNQNGQIKKVDFMNQKDHFYYFENLKMQLLEMKYKNSNLSMYVILPKENGSLTQEDIENAILNKKLAYVNVNIPKFKGETSFELKDIMQDLGIKKAFNEKCEDFKDIMFKGLESNAYISNVIHKTFINVDESGTEAAAVTAIMMKCNCIMPESNIKTFKADHPFIYIIKDNLNDEILFMGNQSDF